MAIRYLVPDGKHLPVTGEDGKPDHHLMGAAWAALHGGYRGNKYEGPDKGKAIEELKRLYKSEGMELPSQQALEPEGWGLGRGELRVEIPCRVLQSADTEGKAWDVEITTQGPSKSGRLDWPREVLQRDAQQFNRVPSYRNHAYEHDVEDLIGHIENPRMGDGALIGTLQVLEPVVWGPKLKAIQAMPDGIAGMSLDCYVECEPPPKGDNGDQPWITRGKQGQGQPKPLKVKRVVKVRSVDLVSPPDAGGRILRAVASYDGKIEWVEGSLAELEPTAGAKQGGLTMKEKISRVLQAIKRFDPARAGTVEAEIAALKNAAGDPDEEKQFERATQLLAEIEPAHVQQKQCHQCQAEVDGKQKFCHQCGAKQKFSDDDAVDKAKQSAISDADRRTLEQASETARQLRLTQSQLVLGQKLADSRLPKPLRDKIAKQFAAHEFTEAELDTEIREVRQTYAELFPGNRATQSLVTPGLDSLDKLQIAMDKLFGVTHENKFEFSERGALRVKQGNPHPGADVPGFRGIREAYVAYTGDADCTGDPQHMRRVTQLESVAAFPLALANTLNRLLVREYAQVDYAWQKIVSQITAPMDFRTQERVRTGYFGDLSQINEDGLYTEISSITDEQATYNVGTFGNTLTITRRAIINDDIGLMKRNVALLGRAAARTLARTIWNLLINNGTYGPDGLNIFHLTHNNLGTALLDSVADAITALNTVKTALFTMTEKDSGERLALTMRYLAVPIELHSEALMLNNSQFTVDASNVRSDNPYYNYFGKADGSEEPEGIIKNPLITDAVEYFIIADPNQVDTLEVGFLQGRQAPEFFLADNPLVGSMFTQDRIVYKVRFEFGATVLDYRGMYMQKNS